MAVSHDCAISIPLERVRVASDRSRCGEFSGGAVANGVTPIRRDLGQRPHDKETFFGARVRQIQFRRRHNFATEGDEIEIKCPWRIRDAALAAELAFNLL
jgi:hypothetical protein